jgi:YVTN family beta-propeller protein
VDSIRSCASKDVGTNIGTKQDLANRVCTINTSTNTVEHTITVGKGPYVSAYDQIHQRMYLSIFGEEVFGPENIPGK